LRRKAGSSPYEELVYQKASVEVEAKFLRRQLKKRFGDLPSWAVEKLASADTDMLERWGENFVEADTLEDVFRDA
jgi:hypothetical protein